MRSHHLTALAGIAAIIAAVAPASAFTTDDPAVHAKVMVAIADCAKTVAEGAAFTATVKPYFSAILTDPANPAKAQKALLAYALAHGKAYDDAYDNAYVVCSVAAIDAH
jgi:hypothetical protein